MRIAYNSVAAFKSKARLLGSLLGIQKTTESLELLAKLSGYKGYYEVARTAPSQTSTGSQNELVDRLLELRPGLADAGARHVIEKLGLRTPDTYSFPITFLVDLEELSSAAAPLYVPRPGQFRPQSAYLEIDRFAGTVNVGTTADVAGTRIWPIWEGPFLRLEVNPLMSGAALANFLGDPSFWERVTRIVNGSVVAEKSNAFWPRDMRDAIDELTVMLDEMADVPANLAELGDVGTFMQDRLSDNGSTVSLDRFGAVDATTTDDTLSTLAQSITQAAGLKRIALSTEDVLAWLVELRAGCQQALDGNE